MFILSAFFQAPYPVIALVCIIEIGPFFVDTVLLFHRGRNLSMQICAFFIIASGLTSNQRVNSPSFYANVRFLQSVSFVLAT